MLEFENFGHNVGMRSAIASNKNFPVSAPHWEIRAD